MEICGKKINDECQYCGKVFECELFKDGHGIRRERMRVSEMVCCQLIHQEERERGKTN